MDKNTIEWLGELFSFLSEIIAPFVKAIFTWIRERLDAFLEQVKDTIDNIKQVLDGIIEFIVGVFTGDWETAWKGIANIVGGIWNAIIDTVEWGVNAVIDAVNILIDGLNGISVDLPGFLGGGHVGFSIGRVQHVDLSGWKIPELAEGAVIPPNREFLALLGDQTRGRNIEAPEELLREIVGEESGNQTINIVAEGDVDQIIKWFRFKIKKEDQRAGKSLIME